MLPMLPLETLPGWPEVADPGVGMVLLILVGLPLAISIPIVLITIGPTWFRQGREQSSEALPVLAEGLANRDVAPGEKVGSEAS
jgi:hypothetical protein